MDLYVYGTPGLVGGTATKIRHLLRLLSGRLNITVIFPDEESRKDMSSVRFLTRLNVSYCVLSDLPKRLSGVVVAICEPLFFSRGVARRLKDKGLRVVWSNETMHPQNGEARAIREGLVDRVLWTSPFQEEALRLVHAGLPGYMVGHYIDPEDFAWRPRYNTVFTIGRVSRPDPAKYPLNFPQFYESLGIADMRFRVMAWSGALATQYQWHRFDSRWELLGANEMSVRDLLYGLDVFVCPLGHRAEKSEGRSVVEAMLTGCPPIIPMGYHFHQLLIHGDSGFICETYDDWRGAVQQLFFDYPLRTKIGKQCAEYARITHCDPMTHRERWMRALFE